MAKFKESEMQIECEIDGMRQLVDESALQKRTGIDTDSRARIEWVEYWIGEKLVHRSANIHLNIPLSGV